jgi:hypothetical protein
MNNDILKQVEKKYIEAGFTLEQREDILIAKNNFSVHYIFYFDDLDLAKLHYSDAQSLLEKDFLSSDQMSDIYWNFYSVFLVGTSSSTDFLEFREKVETDLRISRKFVYTIADIALLPPLFFVGAWKIATETASPWENEWKEVLGEELYDKIIENPKSHTEDIVRQYIDDRFHKNS